MDGEDPADHRQHAGCGIQQLVVGGPFERGEPVSPCRDFGNGVVKFRQAGGAEDPPAVTQAAQSGRDVPVASVRTVDWCPTLRSEEWRVGISQRHARCPYGHHPGDREVQVGVATEHPHEDVGVLIAFNSGNHAGRPEEVPGRISGQPPGHGRGQREDGLRIDLTGVAAGVDGKPSAGRPVDVGPKAEVDQAFGDHFSGGSQTHTQLSGHCPQGEILAPAIIGVKSFDLDIDALSGALLSGLNGGV